MLTGSVFLKADSEIQFREGDDDKAASLVSTIMEGKGRNQKWAEEEATLLWSLDCLTRPRESAGARVTLRNCPASEQSKWALIVTPPSITGREMSLEGPASRWDGHAVETVTQQVRTVCCSTWVVSLPPEKLWWYRILSLETLLVPPSHICMCAQGIASSAVTH